MKIISFIILLPFKVLFCQSVFAQSASLNITLSPPVISVIISEAPAIQASRNGYAKYDEGINAFVKDHINVVSSGAYIVRVAIGDVIGDSKLHRNSIKISPQLGSGNLGNLDGLIVNSALPANFTRNKQITIIEADHASWNGKDAMNTFNVSYLIGADGAFAGRIPGTYIIPVIYTVILK